MNIAKVKNSADFVNYVKPELEMLEMEVEGAILMFSTGRPGGDNGGSNNEGGGKPADLEGGPSFELRSSKPRVRR